MTRRPGTCLQIVAAVGMLLLIAAAAALLRPADARAEPATRPAAVAVKLINAEGALVGPIEVPSLFLAEAEWQKRLSEEQCSILLNGGTERAGTGKLLHNKKQGIYACAACRLPLFISDTKFESGTGWPSFFQPVDRGNVRELPDTSHGMIRTEVECGRCGGHLGHVFDDGPPPTGLRYCINSGALSFVDKNDLKTLADPAAGAAATTQPTH